MRPRSWLAVSLGTLAGSALAITGNPQSRARPTSTATPADGLEPQDLQDPQDPQDPHQDPPAATVRGPVTGGTRYSLGVFRLDTK